MARNYFPTNYKPLYDIKTTRHYISSYHESLSQALRRKHKAIYVDAPCLTDIENSWNTSYKDQRVISFDNKNVNIIAQLYCDVANYLRYIAEQINIDKGSEIYTYIDVVNRDAQCNAVDSMVTKSFILESNTIYDLTNNLQPLKGIYDNLFSDIKIINESEVSNKIKLPPYQRFNIHYISIDQLAKRYPTLQIKTALEMYVISNGPTVVWEACKLLKNNERLFYGKVTSDDYKTTSVLFMHSKETNKVLPIIKVSPRPSIETIKKQLLNDQPLLLQSRVYENTLFRLDSQTNQYIGTEIFFSNLMLINLSKYHLAEVVNSCWDDQFMSFIKSNKIEIM